MKKEKLTGEASLSGACRQAWIRFFPSAFVTRGCSLGVVKVYTSPVSETTSKRTWVPVRVLSSNAYRVQKKEQKMWHDVSKICLVRGSEALGPMESLHRTLPSKLPKR